MAVLCTLGSRGCVVYIGVTWLCCVHWAHVAVLCTLGSRGCAVYIGVTWLCCVHWGHVAVLCTLGSRGCVVYIGVTWLCCVHWAHVAVLCTLGSRGCVVYIGVPWLCCVHWGHVAVLQPGWYVCVHIAAVPLAFMGKSLPGSWPALRYLSVFVSYYFLLHNYSLEYSFRLVIDGL